MTLRFNAATISHEDLHQILDLIPHEPPELQAEVADCMYRVASEMVNEAILSILRNDGRDALLTNYYSMMGLYLQVGLELGMRKRNGA